MPRRRLASLTSSNHGVTNRERREHLTRGEQNWTGSSTPPASEDTARLEVVEEGGTVRSLQLHCSCGRIHDIEVNAEASADGSENKEESV